MSLPFAVNHISFIRILKHRPHFLESFLTVPKLSQNPTPNLYALQKPTTNTNTLPNVRTNFNAIPKIKPHLNISTLISPANKNNEAELSTEPLVN